jgi:hypothetical protein
MNWSVPADLHAQVLRLWDRGILARAAFAASAQTAYPIRLKLITPSSTELIEQFESVRAWIAALQTVAALRIEWREFQHRVLGAQRVPHSIWLDDFTAAAQLLNRQAPAHQLQLVISQTQVTLPALLPWVWANPQRALSLSDVWDKLLAVVQWRTLHPKPEIYLRQVDIPGVHSKFIENHRAVLGALFDLALNPIHVEPSKTNGSFTTRFGFLEHPTRIRFRTLDRRIELIAGTAQVDIKLDADNFSRLDFNQYGAPLTHVFVTENEINFLAFPAVENALVIFGAGYGWEALAKASWLNARSLHYWGDLDTHGFAILHQLRQYFPHAKSLLMDHETLLQHESSWGFESQQHKGDLSRLSPDESSVYNVLRDNRLRQGLRLEQEHIGFDWVQSAVRASRQANNTL